MSFWTDFIISLSPFFIFTGVWAVVYVRGNKVNKKLLDKIETQIYKTLTPYTNEINKVKIRSDEYEFRCKSKSKNIMILTLHLKLVSRSFIIQWIINLFFKERDRLFIGTKFGTSHGEENPVYRFDIVPYRKKSFISQRFDLFVAMDDIPTMSKSVDQRFMVKSESVAYVEHFVDNPEFIKLVSEMENILEHLTLHKSKEDTDPHFSMTYEFFGLGEDYNIADMLKLSFLSTQLHLSNHDTVKKKLAKGKKGKSMTARRGSARSVASRKKKKKTKKK
ncbi:MAG: hypothetical protein ACC656_13445 [Candidatus Heimdallarchaeota archaeon]